MSLSRLPFDVLEKLLHDINYSCQADEEKDKYLNQDLPNLGLTCRIFAALTRPLLFESTTTHDVTHCSH
jgi:hypothetical protein